MGTVDGRVCSAAVAGALLRGDTPFVTNGSLRRAAICGATNTRVGTTP